MHAHAFDHGQDHHGHTVAGMSGEHLSLGELHLVQNISHGEHGDESTSELDISPTALLKKVSGNVLVLALLAFVFVFILLGLYRQTFCYFPDNRNILPRRYILHSPSRAPPQH